MGDADILEKIRAYNAARDAMLAERDVDRLIAFHREHGLPVPPTREFAEVILHKTITAAEKLPYDLRMASARWLRERGYRTLDDGDLGERH